MKRGNILLVILVAVGIVAISVGGYFWWKDRIEPVPIPNIYNEVHIDKPGANDETASWKTFTGLDIDGKNIYAVKVPGGWEEISHSSNFYYLQTFEASDNSNFTVMYKSADGKTLQQYLDQLDKESETAWEGYPSKKIISSKTAKVGSYAAVEREEKLSAADLKNFITYSLINNLVFYFTIQPQNNLGPFETEVGKNYYQILSTFKFLD